MKYLISKSRELLDKCFIQRFGLTYSDIQLLKEVNSFYTKNKQNKIMEVI